MKYANFVTDSYRLIALIAKELNSSGCAHITQDEMGERLGLSRPTIARLMKVMVEQDYVLPDKSHPGRYYLSEKARDVLDKIRVD